jgi:hypothetical protein
MRIAEMNEQHERKIHEALKRAIPPVNTEIGRELWPAVLRKLDAPPVPWYDWALLGMSASVFVFFPRLLLVFAYHL